MFDIVTEKEYEIQYYEIDYKRKLLMTSLMQYLSDVATRQSESLGIGLDYLKEHGIAWVIYKWNIHMFRHPVYGEKIRIRTKPYSFRKFYAYRTFEIVDCNDNVIGYAKSIWFLIDIEKRRAIRINEEMYMAYGINKDKNDKLDIEKIDAPVNIDSEKSFDVRYSDIDTNTHVNNVKYLEWAIETIPLNIIMNYTLEDINITYEKEATYGDSIKVFTEIDNKDNFCVCMHKVVNKENKELALLKTQWIKGE